MLKDCGGALPEARHFAECRAALFGFVDCAETGYVAAERWDGVVGVECVSNRSEIFGGFIGAQGAVCVEVEVCRLHSSEWPLPLGPPDSAVV